MPCIHMRKVAHFLNELQEKGTVTAKTQTVYSYYTHKKQFWETMRWLADKGVIHISENSGNPSIKLSLIYGHLVMGVLNHLCDTGGMDNKLIP
jgi:hypothetical protein